MKTFEYIVKTFIFIPGAELAPAQGRVIEHQVYIIPALQREDGLCQRSLLEFDDTVFPAQMVVYVYCFFGEVIGGDVENRLFRLR